MRRIEKERNERAAQNYKVQPASMNSSAMLVETMTETACCARSITQDHPWPAIIRNRFLLPLPALRAARDGWPSVSCSVVSR